ncbi:hypothetical protein [Pseudomonas sp. MBLB4136]|uniref:hypothetical protein n=1 Tax=Pseudomonas sp. MBLB4136 TaxID=3451558 RepID=UPI003F750E9E
MSEVSLLVEHTLKYTNSKPLTVREVVDSLQALEKVSVHFLPSTLSALSNADIVSAELYVEGLEEGSFIEKVLVKLFFRDEQELEKFLDSSREKLRDIYKRAPGGDYPVMKGVVVVSAALGTLILVGAAWAIATTNEAPPASVTTLTDNTIIIIGAESYGKNPQDFLQIIEGVAGHDKKKLAQQSAKIIAPAKSEEGATVVLDDNESLKVDTDVVKAIPDTVDFDPFEITDPHSDVDLEIRATDLDSLQRGWAAIIPGLVERRVKLKLGENIQPEDLAGKFKVRADVEILYRMSNRTKKMEPVQITAIELISEAADPE